MRKFIAAIFAVALAASAALAQSQQAPTLRIVSEDGNRLPSELMYGNTKVKPLRLRPGTNVPITIDDSDFFVQQHYVDFLSRFPDQSGFAFWQNDINQCGTNVGCIEAHRINVSAAFFLSIEFKETGYFVYKTYKAAFGDLAGKPVPVRRESFMPDTRSISNGVIVNVGNWQQQLDDNKNAFELSFVGRGDFQTAYPSTMTADEFVSKLDTNAGGVLSSAEKANLVTSLGATPADASKRAAVLRAVAENANLHQREFNKAFVLMQYFGYLKRNPDDLPDADYTGYSFWLSKLNQFNGNFAQAEMVKAFINSTEYRTRF
ncbi:MAG: hypothetical protein QOE46_2157 [Acidobacteriota bacterium]|jgi:hypothetical protein|nr:hypothetical protein [Acidobacteriota bacterium]